MQTVIGERAGPVLADRYIQTLYCPLCNATRDVSTDYIILKLIIPPCKLCGCSLKGVPVRLKAIP